jgi:hypothetical protein
MNLNIGISNNILLHYVIDFMCLGISTKSANINTFLGLEHFQELMLCDVV